MKTSTWKTVGLTSAGLLLVIGAMANSRNLQDRRDHADGSNQFVIHDSSVVIADPNNVLKERQDLGTIGPYNYSLDGALSQPRAEATRRKPQMKVVEHKHTGQLALTSGVVTIKYADGVSPRDITTDYDLPVVSELPNINRIAIQLLNFSDYESIRQTLLLDDRVLSVELETLYAPVRPQ